jgi:hypothetical protein
MQIFTGRVVLAYAVILVGAILFLLRRLVLPTTFEIEGVPFDIAVGSVVNSCYNRPALNSCSDLVIVLLTILGVVVATGWRSVGRAIFAVILAIVPLGLYLGLGPIWIPLLALLLIPLAIEVASQLLFPPDTM